MTVVVIGWALALVCTTIAIVGETSFRGRLYAAVIALAGIALAIEPWTWRSPARSRFETRTDEMVAWCHRNLPDRLSLLHPGANAPASELRRRFVHTMESYVFMLPLCVDHAELCGRALATTPDSSTYADDLLELDVAVAAEEQCRR